jgi:hypothetical protein
MKCLELDVVLRLLSEAQGVGSTESRVWLSRAQGWSAAAEMWPTCVRRRRRKVGAQPPRCGRHASAGGGARLSCAGGELIARITYVEEACQGRRLWMPCKRRCRRRLSNAVVRAQARMVAMKYELVEDYLRQRGLPGTAAVDALEETVPPAPFFRCRRRLSSGHYRSRRCLSSGHYRSGMRVVSWHEMTMGTADG